ncbi:DUF4883 family protein [Clostridium sp. DL1XJH146]
MKKGSLIFIISLLIVSIVLLSYYEINKKKPNNYFYTNSIAKNLKISANTEINFFDMNFYKTVHAEETEIDEINLFFDYLSITDFSLKPIDIPKTPKYKIYFTFKDTKEKYVINIYNSKYISVFPWEGDFEMDYVDMSNVPIRYNLYKMCEYIFE